MYVKEMETRAKEDARKKAKEYVVTAIQKCAVDHVAETTISLVQLPNDEMKGRIIGREAVSYTHLFIKEKHIYGIDSVRKCKENI